MSVTTSFHCIYSKNKCRVNTLRPRQNRRHFAEDIFKCIFLNENVWILIRISLKYVPKCFINNNPALVQMMAWRRPGDKPLSEPMMVSLPTHICVIRPQWVNTCCILIKCWSKYQWRGCWQKTSLAHEFYSVVCAVWNFDKKCRWNVSHGVCNFRTNICSK